MDHLITQVLEVGRAMWLRRWIGIAVAWLVAILGAAGLATIRDRFEATARVYVDTKSVLRPLMRDLAVEPDLDQTVGLLARTLITRPNVEFLVGKSFPSARAMPPMERERMIENMTREIKLASSGRDNVFNFSYRGTDPETTRLVVANLVSLFLASDTGNKQRDAQAARDFIDEQIKSYEARLAEAENRLKDFKMRNLGVSDASGKDYFARMTLLTEEMGRLSVELRAAEQSRDALKRELSGETESLVPENPVPSTMQVSEYDARLEAQRKQLDELLRRYTEQHPDVIAAKPQRSCLQRQRRPPTKGDNRSGSHSPRRRPRSRRCAFVPATCRRDWRSCALRQTAFRRSKRRWRSSTVITRWSGAPIRPWSADEKRRRCRKTWTQPASRNSSSSIRPEQRPNPCSRIEWR